MLVVTDGIAVEYDLAEALALKEWHNQNGDKVVYKIGSNHMDIYTTTGTALTLRKHLIRIVSGVEPKKWRDKIENDLERPFVKRLDAVSLYEEELFRTTGSHPIKFAEKKPKYWTWEGEDLGEVYAKANREFPIVVAERNKSDYAIAYHRYDLSLHMRTEGPQNSFDWEDTELDIFISRIKNKVFVDQQFTTYGGNLSLLRSWNVPLRKLIILPFGCSVLKFLAMKIAYLTFISNGSIGGLTIRFFEDDVQRSHHVYKRADLQRSIACER